MATKLTRREMLKLSASFAAAAFMAGCTPKATEVPPAGETAEKTVDVPTPVVREHLNIVVTTSEYGEAASKNSSDIVTPYIENMFDVKFEVSAPPPGQTMKELYALMKAAGTVPDLMTGDRRSTQAMALTGDFADMTDYLPDMPNYTRWIPDEQWPQFKTDGRVFVLTQPGVDGNSPEMKGNIYYEGFAVWPLLAREDILAKCGHKFTPMAEIAKDTTEKGIWPTIDMLGIEPAIDTPEKFEEFLRKIQALDIKVGDNPLLPLCSIWWSVFHISSMYDNGHWRISDEGEVDGYLGLPGAYPWYKKWREWYQDGLLDNDYVIQKDDQLQEKWASGRVATGLMVPNLNAARQALLAEDPTAYVRPIPWPKQNDRYGFFDVFQIGFWCLIINKEFEDIPRLVEMIEYTNSDEGMDIMIWGPPDAGLYVTDADGKKQWKDEETRTNIMENITGTENAEYYGLYSPASSGFTSRIHYALPHCTAAAHLDPRLNYPPQLKIEDVVPRVYSKHYNCGYNTDGRATYGDGGEASGATGDYFWSQFANGEISKLLTAKDEGEYDGGWEEIMKKLETDGMYPEAKADMEKWFAEFGPDA